MCLSMNICKDGRLQTLNFYLSWWERQKAQGKQKGIVCRLVVMAAKSEIDSVLADKPLRIF